jgi:hypothetical protein
MLCGISDCACCPLGQQLREGAQAAGGLRGCWVAVECQGVGITECIRLFVDDVVIKTSLGQR